MDPRVILITFNRVEHTRKVLEGFKNECINEFTIFVDGAETEKDKIKQKKLYSLYETINWANFDIVPRDRDLGLAQSIISAVTETLEKYDSVIVLEDDCVPIRGFKNYMFQTLEAYSNCKKIRSICAHSYACVDPAKLNMDIYFLGRFCPWGWGTWKDRWQDFNPDLNSLLNKLKKANYPLSRIGPDIEMYCSDDKYLKRQSDVWSLDWMLIHYLTNTYAAYPKISLIENIGFDGTGIHSDKTDVFICKYSGPDFSHNITFPKEISINQEMQNKVREYLAKYSIKTMKFNG